MIIRVPTPVGLLTVTVVALLVACSSEQGESPVAPEPLDPAPSVSATAAGPNEPDGFTPVTERAWSAFDEDGWKDDRDNLLYSISTDTTAPRSPDSVGQMDYPVGFTGGSAPAWSSRSMASLGHTELYLSFWMKLSPNWQGAGNFLNRIGYVRVAGGSRVTLIAVGKNSGPLSPQIWLTSTPTGARNLGPNVNDVELVRGAWHRWEVVLVNNTGDSADGEVHWWIDGVKVGQYSDVAFTGSTEGKTWEGVSWRPEWGGSDDVVATPEMYMRMDHWYTSGSSAGADPFLVEDFSTYTDFDHFLTDPNDWYLGRKRTEQMALDTVNLSPEGTQTLRYDFPQVDGCTDYAIINELDLPSIGELWLEAWVRFSANYTTVKEECSAGRYAYKFLLGRTDVSRFQLVLGVNGDEFVMSGPGGSTYELYHASTDPAPSEYFDGQWHRYRMHWRMNGDGTGTLQQWFDDRLVWEATAEIDPEATTFSDLMLGSNRNSGAPEAMSVWWGSIRLWQQNPGW